jgi:hypothetical protein
MYGPANGVRVQPYSCTTAVERSTSTAYSLATWPRSRPPQIKQGHTLSQGFAQSGFRSPVSLLQSCMAANRDLGQACHGRQQRDLNPD